MVSATPLICSTTSIVESEAERVSVRIQRWKPALSTCTALRPGATAANENMPSAPVCVVRAAALDGFKVTTALATAAPWGSATRPVTDNVWAEAAPDATTSATARAERV
jgi:hypothetical protein